ncbi:MAG: hypothetical protein AAGJ84_08845 [Pseudomonadota bacterium]
MIGTFLKWLTVALIALCIFSIATSLFAWYQLNFGSCKAGCEAGQTYYALLHTGIVGLTGFGVSAYASHWIGSVFRGDRD